MARRHFYVFTYQHSGLPLALRLQGEGNAVTVVLVEPDMAKDRANPPRSRKEAEERKKKVAYLEKNGSGLVRKLWGTEAMRELARADRKNTYVIFDQIHGFRYGELLRRRGFKVFSGSRVGYQLETEREKTLALLQRLGIAVPLRKKFGPGGVDAAVEFLKRAGDRVLFVLKSDNPAVVTTVAHDSNEELVQKLNAERKLIEKDSFILQQKVEGIEAAVETWYCNGSPVFANVDIEAKKKYNEMSEVQTGCAFDLLWVTPLEGKLRMLANGPFDRWAGENIWTGILDLSFIYQPTENKLYALEVCGSRPAYDALYTMLELLSVPVGDFFAGFLDGKFKGDAGGKLFRREYAVSLRLFNDESQPDQPVDFRKEDAPHVWLWDVYAKGRRLYTTGDDSIGIITASGENPESALAKLRELFFKVHCPTKWARDDFDDEDDPNLPLARYHELKRLGLVEMI